MESRTGGGVSRRGIKDTTGRDYDILRPEVEGTGVLKEKRTRNISSERSARISGEILIRLRSARRWLGEKNDQKESPF